MGIFKTKSEREIKRLNPVVQKILQLEDKMAVYTDEELRAQTDILKKELADGKTLDEILPVAFAVCREAAWRVLGMKHFPVQIMGGIILHQGRIAEMCTGEGKTLVATLPSYLNALTGKGVHVVTVNDYLAKRDCEQMGKVHKFLGLSVGMVLQSMSREEKQEAYKCDITYCTNVELGFDYLRDNMVTHAHKRMQRGFNFAIVDEIDSILIDEARTPLIISGPGEVASDKYTLADKFARTLIYKEIKETKTRSITDTTEPEDVDEGADCIVELKNKNPYLTAAGIEKAEKFFGVENFSDENNNELRHFVMQAIKAHGVMKKDVDYVIRGDKEAIDIVDEYTGRILEGRRFSEGLHQAIEVKEGVEVKRETKTLATITYQNFFRMYKKLSGMTGTAMTEEQEFTGIYNIDVVSVPTNMPVIRTDEKDALYRTEKNKLEAVIEEIKNAYERKQPVLVGTTTVEKSEQLSKLLKKEKVPHVVLNAKHNDKEAMIVAQAGKSGAVTISTNMAGRGTDIMLGGNPVYMAKEKMKEMGYDEEDIYLAETIHDTEDGEVLSLRKIFNDILAECKKETETDKKTVIENGGLYVIGTERHESRRIDNQLRGRSGRQGDPGRSKFFISFEDDLLKLFGGERVETLLAQADEDNSVLMEGKMISKLVETAQARIEGNHYASRKNVLQYDEVINLQRQTIYQQRNEIIETEDVGDFVRNMIRYSAEETVNAYINEAVEKEDWDIDGLIRDVSEKIEISISVEELREMSADEIHNWFEEKMLNEYEWKREFLGPVMLVIQKNILLQSIDMNWMDHVDAMSELKKYIGLRAYAQKDPVLEYKMEGFDMFEEMTRNIKFAVSDNILKLKIVRRVATPTETQEVSNE